MVESTTYSEAAPAMLGNGWVPVPLRPDTKVPAVRGWPARLHLDAAELERLVQRECSIFAGHACGIVMPPTVIAVDSDIIDAATQVQVLRLALDILGRPAMTRVGRTPKVMLFYSAAPGVMSLKAHPIEIFCGTGQVAAFGLHQMTGKPYRWSPSSPLNTAPDGLGPAVSVAQIRAFLATTAPILAPLRAARLPGNRTVTVNTTNRVRLPATDRLAVLLRENDGRVMPAVRALIDEIGAAGSGRHDALIAVCGRLVGLRWDAERIIEFVAPLANASLPTPDECARGDTDWRTEIEAAVRHAQGRERVRTPTTTKTVVWRSAHV